MFARARVRGGSASALDAITRKSQQWSERHFHTLCHLGTHGLQIAGTLGRPFGYAHSLARDLRCCLSGGDKRSDNRSGLLTAEKSSVAWLLGSRPIET